MSGQDESAGFRSGTNRSRLEEIAYEQGVRDANVDERLRSHGRELEAHENRLKAINGSIDRHATSVQELKQSVERLAKQIGVLVTKEGQRDAVEADREEQSDDAEKRRLDRRTFLIGIWSIAVMLFVGMGGMVTALIVSHH